jgi:hypothetical protein
LATCSVSSLAFLGGCGKSTRSSFPLIVKDASDRTIGLRSVEARELSPSGRTVRLYTYIAPDRLEIQSPLLGTTYVIGETIYVPVPARSTKWVERSATPSAQVAAEQILIAPLRLIQGAQVVTHSRGLYTFRANIAGAAFVVTGTIDIQRGWVSEVDYSEHSLVERIQYFDFNDAPLFEAPAPADVVFLPQPVERA